MHRVRSFGTFLFLRWFIREDGALFLRLKWRPFLNEMRLYGFHLRPFNPEHVVGFYYNLEGDGVFGIRVKNPVALEEENIHLVQCDKARYDTFRRWVHRLV